jgi:gas vesicle protein
LNDNMPNGSNGRHNTLTYVSIGLLGAVAGAVAGLLLAPAPGRDTRRRLGQRLAEEKEALIRRSQLAVEGVSEALAESRKLFDRISTN